MRIRMFEEFGDRYYEEINQLEYETMDVVRIVDFSKMKEAKRLLIPNLLMAHTKSIGSIGNMWSDKNKGVFLITPDNPKFLNIEILEFDDEWFVVRNPENYLFWKCDQWEGVVQLFTDLNLTD